MEQTKRRKLGSGIFKGMMALGMIFDLMDVGEYIFETKKEGMSIDSTGTGEISFKGSDSWKESKKSCEDAIKGLQEQVRYNNNEIDDLKKEIAAITIENTTGGVYTPTNFITYKKNRISDLLKETKELEQDIREMESWKRNHL